MESTEQVKNRIESIEGTKQITHSMRLVSTARFRRVHDRMEGNLPFLVETTRMAREAAAELDVRKHRYVRPAPDGKAICVIVIAGDRGLCGGYNMNACREALALTREADAAKVITVGLKAKDYFNRRRRQEGGVDKAFTGMSEMPFFEDAEEIASCALSWFDGGEVGSVHLVHTRFINMLTLPTVRERLLPVAPPSHGGGQQAAARSQGGSQGSKGTNGSNADGNTDGNSKSSINGNADGNIDGNIRSNADGNIDGGIESGVESGTNDGAGEGKPRIRALARYEPEGALLLDSAVPFYVAASVFGAMLEASVCEQGARIASMDAAVRNSEDMIESLTIQYNKARQSSITEELADIIGGAAALTRKSARSAGR